MAPLAGYFQKNLVFVFLYNELLYSYKSLFLQNGTIQSISTAEYVEWVNTLQLAL